jgi:hypothetical protein
MRERGGSFITLIIVVVVILVVTMFALKMYRRSAAADGEPGGPAGAALDNVRLTIEDDLGHRRAAVRKPSGGCRAWPTRQRRILKRGARGLQPAASAAGNRHAVELGLRALLKRARTRGHNRLRSRQATAIRRLPTWPSIFPAQSKEDEPLRPQPAPFNELTPQQIVAELDKYIVGQHAARRSVAVPCGTIRRQKLPPGSGEVLTSLF